MENMLQQVVDCIELSCGLRNALANWRGTEPKIQLLMKGGETINRMVGLLSILYVIL